MLDHPQFKSRYTVETLEPDRLFLLSEQDSICLGDRLYYQLAALIDGDRRIDEIFDRLQLELLQDPQNFSEGAGFQDILNISLQIQRALFQLEQQGYLVERDDSLQKSAEIFCDRLGVAAKEASERLRSITVAVKSVGSIDEGNFIDLLASMHVQIAEEGDLTVILAGDYLDPQLKEWNERALATRSPWLLVKPTGNIPWIGPFFNPQKTGCWECLASRLRENRPIASFIQRKKQDSKSIQSPQGFLPSTMQTVLGMAATEVFKWIVSGGNTPLEGTLLSYDTLTLQTQTHFLVKRPQCQSCGQMKGIKTRALPVVLGHRQKTFTRDGGHRSRTPEETLQTYRHHVSPITGVVRDLQKLPGHDLNHSYIARHHFRNIFDDLDNLRKNIGGRSAGKGMTDAQAKASGFCEAIERYSGVWQGYEVCERGSYASLGDRAIHPNACMNFSPAQYETRSQWNQECDGWFQKVPDPFDEEREIAWTPVWSLSQQDFKYLPTAYCYYGYTDGHLLDCWADSNGCAAGNTMEEAILQGFMELVERDAVALWWYNFIHRPRVDLESFNDPYFQRLQAYYESLERDLWVLDITSDLGIPTFAAITNRRDRKVEDIVLGYGSHLDARIAIARALTEVNQILPNVLSVKKDGSTQYPTSADPLAISWWTTVTLADCPYLKGDETGNKKTRADYQQMASHDLLEDVKLCQKIVEDRNMELLVLDQTRPDIGLRVVKVIVPGMRHMWRRLGEGRLYDVPLKMGWLTEKKAERQLNSFPMWM
ncbi:MAG: TOMM precursor leader peptide-binding protein [Cyanobacteria bacterium P01_E01_bin.42]